MIQARKHWTIPHRATMKWSKRRRDWVCGVCGWRIVFAEGTAPVHRFAYRYLAWPIRHPRLAWRWFVTCRPRSSR